MAQNSPASASELFPFCANSYLRRNFTLRKNCPAGTSDFISFWRQLGSPLGMKIPGDSFSGNPIRFRWRLGTNSFWRQLGSSLELSRWHLVINSVWYQLGLPLGFLIPGDSFSWIPPCFPLLEFTLFICSWGTTFSPVGGLLFLFFLGELHVEARTLKRVTPSPITHRRSAIISWQIITQQVDTEDLSLPLSPTPEPVAQLNQESRTYGSHIHSDIHIANKAINPITGNVY